MQDWDCYVFIVGFEDGKINIEKFLVKNKKIEIIYELNEFLVHFAKIKFEAFVIRKINAILLLVQKIFL